MSEPKKIMCKKCRGLSPFETQIRDVDGLPGVTDCVIVCLVCGSATHSHYLNDRLEAMRDEIGTEREPIRCAKLTRAYNRKFASFQATIEKRMARETLE